MSPESPTLRHAALRILPSEQRPLLVELIRGLLAAIGKVDLNAVSDGLDAVVFNRQEPVQGVPERSLKLLETFLTEVYEEDLHQVIEAVAQEQGLAQKRRNAKPEQLAILVEAQREVGLDFTPFFEELTSWQADCLIKGCVAISEIQRQTGDRHFPLKDLRRALREYIHRRGPDERKGSRP